MIDKFKTKQGLHFKYIKYISLFILALFLGSLSMDGENDILIIISNISFIVGIIFLIIACSSIVSNLGVLDIAKYSFKAFFNIFKSEDNDKDLMHNMSYAEYRETNKKNKEYKYTLSVGTLMLSLSFILAIIN